jgi:outer membrane protein
MKHSWILSLCLVPVAFGAEPTVPQSRGGPMRLNLKEAVALAISPEGSARVQLAAEALKQAQARSAQARSALLPNLDAALADRNSTVNLAANGLTSIAAPIPGFHFPSLVGPFSTMDLRLSASQSVFDVGSIRRFQASRGGASAARSDLENTEDQVAAQVARAYLSAIRADADVETAQANLALSRAVLMQAENQKTAGTGTGIEITRARVQQANDQQRLLVAENARRSAHLQFLRGLNLPLDTEVELTDKLGHVPADVVTLEQAKSQALAARADLRAQQQREAAAKLSVDATRGDRLPSVSAFGDYGSIGPGVHNLLPTRTYGLTVRIPLFDGGRRGARLAESQSQYRAEEVRTRDMVEQIELELRLAIDALQSAEAQVAVAREGLELAEGELTQARRRYDAGVAAGLEVTDAQTRLERARDNQTEALYNYNMARIDLEKAMGAIRRTMQ